MATPTARRSVSSPGNVGPDRRKQAALTQLQNQHSYLSSVSLDQQATSLQNLEQAYQAASKVFAIINTLIGSAINLGTPTTVSTQPAPRRNVLEIAMQINSWYLSDLTSSLQQIATYEQQLTSEISSGARVHSLSDDPLADGENLLLAKSIQQNDSYQQATLTAGCR